MNATGIPTTGASAITICLYPGWNMISSPYPTGSGLDNCTVDDDLIMAPAPIPLTGGGNVLTDQFIYEYVGGSYVQIIVGGQMVPNVGYWIRNLTAGIVYLTMNGVPKPGMLPSEQVWKVPAPGDDLPPGPPGGVGVTRSSGGGGCGPREAGVLDPPVLFVVLILLFGLRRVRQVV